MNIALPANTPDIRDRVALQSALAEACELEHGLACSYLYAGFSAKRHLSEGLTVRQQQLVRKWASQIYFIASQEMLHLAQAWNLLAAVGGSAFVERPNFPQPSRRYPLHIPLGLAKLDESSLARFIRFERPEATYDRDSFAFASAHVREHIDAEPQFDTIGRLYELIERAITRDPSLIVGEAAAQVGPELVDFPDLVPVVDADSAAKAVRMIQDQGEGLQRDRIDCHYGMFRTMLRELCEEQQASRAAGAEFVPARNAIENPCYEDDPAYRPQGSHLIEVADTRAAGVLFDDLYGAMLAGLQFVFMHHSVDFAVKRRIAALCIDIMPAVLVPLGEALTTMPSGRDDRTAGAGFFLGRFVPLPSDGRVALGALLERFRTLEGRARRLAASVPSQAAVFEHVSEILHERVSQP